MARPPFRGSFTQQAPLPAEALEAAAAVLQTGRLHRYNTAEGEVSQTDALEREFAAWQGARYCLAVASGGQAMQIALRAAGIGVGDIVLTNAFTLAPVPGAIAAVGAEARLVETTERLVLDFEDLEARAEGAKALLVSHMRGHLCDMEALRDLCDRLGLILIEDCAHTMGATWSGRRSGNFGLAGCFSTQTYKHLNSGEGGLLTSDDASFMARATMLSGSYMMYGAHGAGPGRDVYEDIRLDTPNMSARMDDLRAAVLRPQLARLDGAVEEWNLRHDRIQEALRGCARIEVPPRPAEEAYVGSSIQFRLPGVGAEAAASFVDGLAGRGVQLAWAGRPEPRAYASTHESWRYLRRQALPRTDRILSELFDMRIPRAFDLRDCDLIAGHIVEEAEALGARVSA